MTSSSKKNLRKTLASAIAAGAIAIVTLPARAESLIDSSGLATTGKESKLPIDANIPKVVGSITGSILGLLGTIFLTLIVYAGFLWMTAQGADDKIKKAKNIIASAIIGLVITFGAFAIATFVSSAIQKAL